MDFKCISVLSTEQLMDLKEEVEKVLNDRRAEEAQKIWDSIMDSFRALVRMNAPDTMVTDNESVYDLYNQFSVTPEWEFEEED